jgi:Protein of unknown function (DUF2934)
MALPSVSISAIPVAPTSVFSTRALAYKRWELRGGRAGSSQAAMADWVAAARVRHQMIAEAAYLRWLGRDCGPGDPRADWFAAEAGIIAELKRQDRVVGLQAATRLRDQLVAEAAYRHWESRDCPPGAPLVDWLAAEAEIPDVR